jgi:Fe-S-cluster-containing hydrogenase component 2
MEENQHGIKYPVVNEDGCSKCNSCLLYCPQFNPVSLPEFEDFYEYQEEYGDRDMAAVYRETKRQVKAGVATPFVGTLCQIAALKSLMGDRLSDLLKIYPMYCDPEKPKRPECVDCQYYK